MFVYIFTYTHFKKVWRNLILILSVTLFVTVFIFLYLPKAYADNSPQDEGIIAHYPLDGNAMDATGNGYDGTFGGTFVSDRFGNLNQALLLDGVDDYMLSGLNMADHFFVNDPVAFSVWFQTTMNGRGPIVSGALPGNGPDFFAHTDEQQAGHISPRLYGGDKGVSDNLLNDGQWHHIVWGTDGASPFFYVDGVQQALSPTVGLHSRDYITLGAGGSLDLAGPHFIGNVDDLRVYQKGLSESEVQALFNDGVETFQCSDDIDNDEDGFIDEKDPGCHTDYDANNSGSYDPSISNEQRDENIGLVAYYPFSEDANDKSGNERHGTIYGASPFSNNITSSAYYFDGIDDYIDIPDLYFKNVTVSAIVRYDLESVPPNSNGKKVSNVVNGWKDTENFSLLIREYPEGKKFIGAFHDYTETGLCYHEFVSLSDTIIQAGEYYHVSLTYDGQYIRMYINGEFESEAMRSGATYSCSANLSILPDIRIGVDRVDSGYFKGLIDEVRLYDYALNEEEIDTIYKSDMYGMDDLPQCSDEIDNDGDGLTDEADPGCWTDPEDLTTYDPSLDSENELPVITLQGDNPLTLEYGQVYEELGATAYDEEDGDLEISITIPTTIDPFTPETYTVIYTTTDSQGLTTEMTRAVEVLEEPEEENNSPIVYDLEQSYKTVLEEFQIVEVGESAYSTDIVFSAFAEDLDMDAYKIEFEVRPVNEAFTGSGDAVYSSQNIFYAGKVEVLVSLEEGEYHWRACAIDSHGATSEWMEYGQNDIDDIDLAVDRRLEPYPYGYKFQNAHPGANILTGGITKAIWLGLTIERHKISGNKWNIFESTFDLSELNSREELAAFDSVGLNDPDVFQGGNCYGMAVSSAMHFSHLDYMKAHYSNFVQQIEDGYVWDIPPVGAATSSTEWNQYNDTLRTILSFQLSYKGDINNEAIQEVRRQGLDSPRKILDELKNNPDKTYILNFSGKKTNKRTKKVESGGHAVIPYRVEGNRIYIWDNNFQYPYRVLGTTTYQAYQQYIDINSDNTWETSFNYYDVEKSNILLVDIDLLYNNGKKPRPLGFGEDIYFTLIGDADIQVIDSEGRIAGFQDGDVINEIPDVFAKYPAMALLDDDEADSRFQSIYIPRQEDMMIKITGRGEGSYNLMTLGGDYYLRISDVVTQDELQDEFIVSRDKVEIAFGDERESTYKLLMEDFQQDDEDAVYLSGLPVTSQLHTYEITWDEVVDGGNTTVMYGMDLNDDGVIDKEVLIPAVYKDEIPPYTKASISGIEVREYTFLSPVTMTLIAEDDIGVKKTEYSYDGEDWLEYTGTTTISEEGEHTIWYRSTDWFGNVEEAQSVLFSIVSAQRLKEQAVEKLEGAKYGNKRNDRRIGAIIKAIDKSLNDAYWSDRNTLDPKRGSSVFRWEGKAVALLNGYITLSQQSKFAKKYNFPPEAIEMFEEVLQDLFLADRIIVELAYDNVEGKGFDHPMKQKQYQRLFTQIRALIDAGNELCDTNPRKALVKYIEAWNKMMQLNKLK